MDLKHRRVTPIRVVEKFPRDDNGTISEPEKLTSGVPLVKLIKRKLVSSPELVMLSAKHSVAAERFRRLKARLVNEQDGSLGVIVVTSAAPGEGKSLVSINTALAFAADLKGEVLLIDADMRRPGIARWLDPVPKFGFSEVLAGKTGIEHALIEIENSALRILPAGSPTKDPVELLSSDRAEELFLELRKRFRHVIVDSPPIVPFTDADVVGGLSDGILLVARSEQTQKGIFARAVDSVTSTKLLGAVLNDASFSLADRGHYYDYKNYYQERR